MSTIYYLLSLFVYFFIFNNTFSNKTVFSNIFNSQSKLFYWGITYMQEYSPILGVHFD